MGLRIHHLLLPADDRGPVAQDPLWPLSRWAAKWLLPPKNAVAPFVAAYRLRLEVGSPARLRIHLSADERCRFVVDGSGVTVGPPRSDVLNWRFLTFDLELDPGTHWLAAQLWRLGESGPFSQLSAGAGFILAGEGGWHEKVSTGAAPWEARLLDAFAFEHQPAAWGVGKRAVIDGGALPWGWECGEGGGFAAAEAGPHGYCSPGTWSPRLPILKPDTLSPLVDEQVPNGTALLVDAVTSVDVATPPADPRGDLPAERRGVAGDAGWPRAADASARHDAPLPGGPGDVPKRLAGGVRSRRGRARAAELPGGVVRESDAVEVGLREGRPPPVAGQVCSRRGAGDSRGRGAASSVLAAGLGVRAVRGDPCRGRGRAAGDIAPGAAGDRIPIR